MRSPTSGASSISFSRPRTRRRAWPPSSRSAAPISRGADAWRIPPVPLRRTAARSTCLPPPAILRRARHRARGHPAGRLDSRVRLRRRADDTRARPPRRPRGCRARVRRLARRPAHVACRAEGRVTLGNPDRPVGGLAVPRPAGVELRPFGRDDFADALALVRELYALDLHAAPDPHRSAFEALVN